ncbi:MAG TPA: GlxA family transcriptional regulator [Steroidobacteraceae bacterium]|jgi:transcriptional regulator GlxA family with amidase domain|nr:GlxA family transcriptional regulator [Steroidobacteraceae bacterium]
MPLKTVCIVAFPRCQSLDVTGPYEVFAGANQYLQSKGKPAFYRVRMVSTAGLTIETQSGLKLRAETNIAKVRGAIDTLIIAGGPGSRELERDVKALDTLRRLAGTPRRVASVCTGAFVLAAMGLLEDKRATTHWVACKDLANRYPTVRVDADPIYVRDGRIYTSAGATAGIDLALALVEADLGRDVALTIARWLVLYLRRTGNQRQFSVPLQGQVAERDALRRVQAYARDHLNGDLAIERLSELCGMSPRHFARCFKAEVGVTPARYVSQLRMEAARRLLEEGRRPIEQIARECGFNTPETLRRTFARELKTPPREYRRRFLLRPNSITSEVR